MNRIKHTLKGSLIGLYQYCKFALVRTINIKRIGAVFTRNGGRQLVHTFMRMLVLVGGRFSPFLGKSLAYGLLRLSKIARTRGLVGLVLTLKACSVALQQSIAGHIELDIGKVGMRVARSKSGLPLIIPRLHRSEIRKGNTFVIRVWMTVFATYRVLMIPCKLKIGSILNPRTTPSSNDGRLVSFAKGFNLLVNRGRSTAVVDLIRVAHGPFPIFKSAPNRLRGTSSTDPINLIVSAVSLTRHPVFASLMVIFHTLQMTGIINLFRMISFEDYLSLCKVKWKDQSVKGSKLGTRFTYLNVNSLKRITYPEPVIGQLGLLEEAAGKLRVFAMLDPWSQWALKPLHTLLFSRLRKLPMDGTFNQLKPIRRLMAMKCKSLYSLDLSSATDRMPLSLQIALLTDLFGRELASAIETLLIGRLYHLPVSPGYVESGASYRYAVGQPMGAYGSWGMMAYTHHFLVQCAAWRVGFPVNHLFTKYALLGDDLVIGDKAVAKSYLRILKLLGMEVGLHKSILSPKGLGIEFAKRTFFKGQDVSPVPFKEFATYGLNLASIMEIVRKYNVSVPMALKALGKGYKVIGSCMNHNISTVNSLARAIRVMLAIPQTEKQVLPYFRMYGEPLLRVCRQFIELEKPVILAALRRDFRRWFVTERVDTELQTIWSTPGLAFGYLEDACRKRWSFINDPILMDLLVTLQISVHHRSMTMLVMDLFQLEQALIKGVNVGVKSFGTSFMRYIKILTVYNSLSTDKWTRFTPDTSKLDRGPVIPLHMRLWKRWSPVFAGERLEPVAKTTDTREGAFFPIGVVRILIPFLRSRIVKFAIGRKVGVILSRLPIFDILVTLFLFDLVLSFALLLLIGSIPYLIECVLVQIPILLSALPIVFHYQVDYLSVWSALLSMGRSILYGACAGILTYGTGALYMDWDLIMVSAGIFREVPELANTDFGGSLVPWAGFIVAVLQDVVLQPLIDNVLLPWTQIILQQRVFGGPEFWAELPIFVGNTCLAVLAVLVAGVCTPFIYVLRPIFSFLIPTNTGIILIGWLLGLW